jgi:hypothetical protein
MSKWATIRNGVAAGLLIAGAAAAEGEVFEPFDAGAETRWEYIADGVMGGVSYGTASIETVEDRRVLRLQGTVSTANNGGFIQARRKLPAALPEGTQGLSMEVRGNDERYYLFIRTKEMMRPWFYYSAAFGAPADWSSVEVPLAAFERSHAHLAEQVDPGEVISLGIVAYGRDHTADLSVGPIALY